MSTDTRKNTRKPEDDVNLEDDFDRHFNLLIEKGFLEQVGINALGEPEYRLSQKAIRLNARRDVSQATDDC